MRKMEVKAIQDLIIGATAQMQMTAAHLLCRIAGWRGGILSLRTWFTGGLFAGLWGG